MKKQILTLIVIATFALTVNAQIKIFTGGKVSVGTTTSPAGSYHQVIGNTTFLQSTGSITSSAYVRGNNSYSTATTPEYTWLGNDQCGMFHPAANTIAFTNGTGEKLRINSSGNVQINSTSLNAANLNIYNNQTGFQKGIYLDINQSADYYQTMTTKCYRQYSMNYVVNLNNVGDQFYVAGAGWIYSQGNYLGSDINIKDDVYTLDSALAKINAIRGVRYKLIKEKQNPSLYGGSAKEYMGVIAQEVELVAPQAVRTFSDGTKGVCYEMLVGLLIEAIKEQEQHIKAIETDLANCCNAKPTNKMMNQNQNQNTNNQSGDALLYQNIPNPFNTKTNINYYLPDGSNNASLLVFDMQGKLIKTYKINSTGNGNIEINAGELQPGMYMYSLISNEKEIDTKKMILTE